MYRLHDLGSYAILKCLVWNRKDSKKDTRLLPELFYPIHEEKEL